MLVITLVHRREGKCPLPYELIREVLEYTHEDFRFTITRYGVSDSNEAVPAKLSINIILSSHLEDYFKDILYSFADNIIELAASKGYLHTLQWCDCCTQQPIESTAMANL